MRSRTAFTLTELLIALGVGMIVLNAAFVVFLNTGKFFKRIESVGTKDMVAQSAILWVITKDSSGSQFATDYPVNERQMRKVGVTAIDSSVGGGTYYKVTIDEIPIVAGVDKPVIQPVNLFIPKAY